MSRLFIRSFIFLLVFFCLPMLAHAAEMRVVGGTSTVKTGDTFTVRVLLTTDAEINAVQGTLTFPQDLLRVKDVQDGNSFVNFWVQRPMVAPGGQINFSGIIPGGIKPIHAAIFSVVFEARAIGSGSIKLQNAQTLKNDGYGTAEPVTLLPFVFSISREAQPIAPSPATSDQQQPETFLPQIGHASSVYHNQWFIAFTTQDKNSGVDHYEVKETQHPWFAFLIPWKQATSPYILEDQQLTSSVYIKAVDRDGNARVMTVARAHAPTWYHRDGIWVLLVLVLLGGGLFIWFKRR